MKTWKQTVRALFLLCGLLVLFAPGAKAQLTDDGKVDFVQAHFHFKDASGNDIDHNRLKVVLLRRNGNGTYLDQGVVICTLMDTRDKFAVNNYRDTTSDIANEAIGALGYPSFIDAGLQALELLLEAYPGVGEIILAYQTFSQLKDAWNLINDVVSGFQDSLINGLVRDYIATVPDPDQDQEEWSDLQIVYGALIKNTDFDLHNYCRTEFRINQQLTTSLPGQVDRYASDVNSLIAGRVVFQYSPNPFSLYAPVEVNIDASGSTGTEGSTIDSVKSFL